MKPTTQINLNASLPAGYTLEKCETSPWGKHVTFYKNREEKYIGIHVGDTEEYFIDEELLKHTGSISWSAGKGFTSSRVSSTFKVASAPLATPKSYSMPPSGLAPLDKEYFERFRVETKVPPKKDPSKLLISLLWAIPGLSLLGVGIYSNAMDNVVLGVAAALLAPIIRYKL